MKILIIEDEPAMLESMANSLRMEQFIVETASNFPDALGKATDFEYDCILLDIGLPGGDGLTILKELKKENKADGVIIVSAKNSLDDKVNGLDLGADDYLAKPFHLAELNARVKSVIRRRKLKGNDLLICNNLEIDVVHRSATLNGDNLSLNRKEFDVLLYLAMNKNRLVNKSAIAEHVWGDYIDEANSFDFIYSQIKNLRKKLKDNNAEIEIQAVYGIGYKLVAL
jgi:DNA-binding response OmpR family regulator